jgi:hypothetical protein
MTNAVIERAMNLVAIDHPKQTPLNVPPERELDAEALRPRFERSESQRNFSLAKWLPTHKGDQAS